MSIIGIILAVVVVGATGLFIGIFLGVSDKAFAVETDEREDAILEVTAADAVMPDVPALPRQSWPVKPKSADAR